MAQANERHDGIGLDAAASGAARMMATGWSPRRILTAVFKDRRRILMSMAATLIVAGALAAVIVPKYVADATLLVLLSSDYSYRPSAGRESASAVMLERDTFLKSEVEILTSPSLEKTVLRKLGLARVYPDYVEPGWRTRLIAFASERLRAAAAALGLKLAPPRAVDPIDLAAIDFAKDLTAKPDKAGNIIVVAFRHRDPGVAADVVNTLIDAYLAKRAELFSDVQSPVVADRADALLKQLNLAARAYADFKARNNISDYNTQREILLRQQGDISRDMQRAVSDVAQLTQRSAVLQRELDQLPQDVVVYHSTPSMVRRGRANVLDALEVDRTRVAQDLEAGKARRDADAAQLKQIQDAISRLEANAFELERLDRERNLLEENYHSVIKVFDERKFQEEVNARKAATVRVIQPAEIPVEPGNLRMIILAAALMLCLFVGALVAVLSEIFRRGYILPETLERDLGLPVLANIPRLARAPDLIGLRRPVGLQFDDAKRVLTGAPS